MPINDPLPFRAPQQDGPVVVSVSNVNSVISSILKGDRRLNNVRVKGEISQFTRNAKSGHWYFTIKDATAVLKCVMFTFNQGNVQFQPAVGMTVICTGSIDVYAPNGEYSLKCTNILPEGEGAQAAALQALKNRLEAEGLFAQKRPIASRPKKIAVITSGSGAAFKDITDVITDRYPLVKLVLVPTQVQGETAPMQIANAIRRAAAIGADTLIIGRGGGATDTLEAFNTEIVVRAIYESPIPTISAVGHGINISLADFAADRYAPTPSAAANDATPDIKMYIAGLDDMKRRLSQNMQRRLAEHERDVAARAELIRALTPMTRINALQQYTDSLDNAIKTGIHNRLSAAERGIDAKAGVITALSPEARLNALQQRVDGIEGSIKANIRNRLTTADNGVTAAAEMIAALNPLAILARGYSVTESGGRIITSVNDISSGDAVSIRLADGKFTAQVTSIERNDNTDGI